MALLLTDDQVAEVRARIREVAERVVAAEGLGAVSLRSIAAELGWTAASLYRYFANKAELVDALRVSAHNRFSERIEAAYASSDDLWERSRAIGDAYADFAQSDRAAYQLMFAYEQDEAGMSDALRAAHKRSRRTLTKYVAEMVDAGLLVGDPAVIAHAYWAAIHGLVMLKVAGKLDPNLTFEDLRGAIARLITRGARPDSARKAD